MLAQDIGSLRFYRDGNEIDPSMVFVEMYSGLDPLVKYNQGLNKRKHMLGSKSSLEDLEDYDAVRTDMVSKWTPPSLEVKIKTTSGVLRTCYLEPRKDIYFKPDLTEKTPSIARLIVEDDIGKDMVPIVIRQSRGKYSEYEAERMPSIYGSNNSLNLLPVPESSYITTIEGMTSQNLWNIEDVKKEKKIPRIIPKMVPFSVNNEGEILSVRNWYPGIDSQGFETKDIALMLGIEWGLGFVNPDRAYYELCSVPRRRPIFDIDPDYRLIRSGKLGNYDKWRNFITASEYQKTIDCLNGIEERRKTPSRKIPDNELCGLRICEKQRKGLRQESLSIMDSIFTIFPQKDIREDISRKVDENLVREVYGEICLF
jgi:hypothetical protein